MKNQVLTTFEVNNSFNSIDIQTDCYDINLQTSADGKCSVIYHDRESSTRTVNVQDDTLFIEGKFTGHQPLSHFISSGLLSLINHNRSQFKITIKLPKSQYDSLDIHSASGDVSIPNSFRFTNVKLSSSVGDISCSCDVTEMFEVNSSAGDISLRNANGCSLKVKTSAGDISLSGMKLKNLDIGTSCGDVKISSVTVDDGSKIKTSAGDIKIIDFDGQVPNIKTVCGDVEMKAVTKGGLST